MSIARFERSRRPAMVPFNVWFFSRVTRKLTQTSSTHTAGARSSEPDGKVPLACQEHDGSEEEEPERPDRRADEVAGRGPARAEDLLEGRVRRVQRVPTQVRHELLRDLAHEVQHRRDVQPDARRVRKEATG